MGRSAEGAAQRQAAAAERASQRQAAAAERAAARAQAAAVRGAKAQEREQARATRAAEVGAQRAAMAYVRAEEQKRRAARTSAEARERAEREATSVARTEAAKRNLTAEQEARVKQQTLERLTRTYEAEERRRTAAAKREQREREREQREREREARRTERTAERERRGTAATISQGVTAAAGAAGSFASTSHGLIQDARRSRAQADRSIAQAVRDSGGNEADVTAARSRVRRFVKQTGIPYEDVAGALEFGQQRGSSLEAMDNETRGQALDRSLSLIREANAENTPAGEYLAASGRLHAVGLSGPALTNAMRFALAAAQSGQVEVAQIIQQGLPGASRLMAQRADALTRNPGETDAAFEARRQDVRLRAFRESVATQEILAASGGNAGRTSNTLAGLQNFMNTPRRQELALTNIRAAESAVNTSTPAGRDRAAALRALYEGDTALFERDPTRNGNAMRLREGVSPIELATRVARATGGGQAGANIFAGGGHGNAQSFLNNMRDLMAVLGGERGQAISAAMNAAPLTQESITARQAAVESDDLSNLTRVQEAGTNALTDNTDAVNSLSNRVADWAAANPLHSTAATVGGGLLASTLGPAAANRIGSWAAGTRIGQMLGVGGGAAAGAAGSGGAAGAGGAARVLGGVGGRAVPILGAAMTLLNVGNDIRSGRSAGQTAVGAIGDMFAGGASVGNLLNSGGLANAARNNPPTAGEIGTAVAAALRAAPLTATVAPTDAAQAASRAPAPGR